MSQENKTISEWLSELSKEDEKEALENVFRLVINPMHRLNTRCSSMYQALHSAFMWKDSGNPDKWAALAEKYSNNSK